MCFHSNYCTSTKINYIISSLLWFLDPQINSNVNACTCVCVSLHVNLNTFQGNIYSLAVGYMPSSLYYQWLVVVVVYRTRVDCWSHSSYWWDHSLNHPKGGLYGRTGGCRKQIWSTAPHSQCRGLYSISAFCITCMHLNLEMLRYFISLVRMLKTWEWPGEEAKQFL